VKSPTYGLVEEYQPSGRLIYHFDLYRLKDPDELEWIGMHDYLRQKALCCIEWPQMGMDYLPPADVEIKLRFHGQRRTIEINTLADALKNNLSFHWKNKDLLL
jgi:ATPase, YjeE family